MHIQIEAEFANKIRSTYQFSMEWYGNPQKYSAMSKTVGFPTAIATEMVIDGKLTEKGLLGPF